MKRKTEKAHFNDQWELMVIHLKAFIAAGDQEELHLFRVQVKKLRAMLELFDTDSSKPRLSRHFKPVRKIFKHGGEIRNAYINLQFAVRYQFKNEEFLLARLSEIESRTDEFKDLGKAYLKTIKVARQSIEHDIKTVADNKVVEFYTLKLDEAAAGFDKLQFDDTLHNARKQVKTLLYNRKLAANALDGRLEINNNYLDKLQALVGDWHDNMLALELFSTLGLNEKIVLTKIKRQNTRLKRSIAVLVQDFMNKAVVARLLTENEE